MGSFEIAYEVWPCLVVGGASAPITARFFHLAGLKFKVVCHAYNLSNPNVLRVVPRIRAKVSIYSMCVSEYKKKMYSEYLFMINLH